MAYRTGVDVAGTFTDLVLAGRHGRLVLDKHPTTPHDQSEGVLGGSARLAGREGLAREALLAATDLVVHGTTTADNTMIEMSGATTGLVTSEGHRDEIEIRRGYKEDIWDPALPPPPPLCPRRGRSGVPERLDFEGNVIVPLDEEAVRRACRRMQRQGVDSLAVVLLFSFVNPAHERRVRAIAAEELPGVMVSLSHEVMPSAPEFERTSTTLVNAYVGPKIGRYLSQLDERLRAAGFAGELLIMQSNGGVMPGGYVAEKAVAAMGSGPAGGVNGATAVAGQAGIRDFISVDMGGTSYDVCLVRGGAPDVKAGWNWHHRYLIGLPMVDVQSVGAGGGSIARVESGALRVGPESAGAEPGPVCYGRGGVEPTVTDANLVLGYLNPGSFCGGTMRLDVEGALAAIRERVAKPLGVSVVEAAEGIFRLVNANMAHAVRARGAERTARPAAALRAHGRALLPGPDLRHAGAAPRAPGAGHRPRARRYGRALPPPARGAAHLRLPRRGADPARAPREGGRGGGEARPAAPPAQGPRQPAPRRAQGLLPRSLRRHPGLRRRAARPGSGDPRSRHRRGAVHHHRRLPGAARDGGRLRQLHDHARARVGGLATTTDLTFPSASGRPMRAALALPPGGARRPAVIVIHEIFRLNDDIRRMTGRFADLGYVALAPDLYDAGRPRVLCIARTMLALRRKAGPEFADLEAARAWLAARPEVDPSRTGVARPCLGRGSAFLRAG